MKPTLIGCLDKKEISTEITNCFQKSGRFTSRTVLEDANPKHSNVYYEYMEANNKTLNLLPFSNSPSLLTNYRQVNQGVSCG